MLRFSSGLVGQIGSVWSMVDGPGFSLEIWGSHGRLAARAPILPQSYDTRLFASESSVMGQRTEKEVEIPERLKVIEGSSIQSNSIGSGLFPMASVFASIRKAAQFGGEVAPDFEQALHVHEVVEAAGISSNERRWVNIRDL
jgi:predicted dehydrogenase